MIAYPTFCQLRQAWDEEHLTMAQIARARWTCIRRR